MDIRPKVTREQFEGASSVAKEVRSVIALRDKLLSEKKIDAKFTLPSEGWRQTNELFTYCLEPSYDVVDTWRLHTIMFTGNYLGSAIGNKHNAPKKLAEKYLYFSDGLPEDMIVRPPEICAERGWEINGGIVNTDTIMYQRHMNVLYRSGIMGYLQSLPHLNILDIGSGYGGFARAFQHAFPNANYYMVDLPESMVFSAVYLRVTTPEAFDADSIYNGHDPDALLAERDGHFTFVPNFLVNDLAGKIKFDLIINTGSLGEMTQYQIEKYASFINEALAPRGVFYEDNGEMCRNVPNAVGKFLSWKRFEGSERIWFRDSGVSMDINRHRSAMRRKLKYVIWDLMRKYKTLAKGMWLGRQLDLDK